MFPAPLSNSARAELSAKLSLARSAGARITLSTQWCTNSFARGEVKASSLVIKADVQGSVEVLSEMLPEIPSTTACRTENYSRQHRRGRRRTTFCLRPRRARSLEAFNVRPDRQASDLAQREGVEIRPHSVI